MSHKYPVEALLRPPVELWAALCYGCVALILLMSPALLMMTPSVAWATASAMALLGLRRFRQGRRIQRYQHNLIRLPFYQLSSRQIPVSHRKLFLGKGFAWDSRHTQRLIDTQRREYLQYTQPPLLYRVARALEVRWEHQSWAKPVLVLLAKPHLLAFTLLFRLRIVITNPLAPLPPVGGRPAIHAVGLWESERDIFMDLGERVGHTLVLGTTRVGKTRLAEILITQDIHRGDVVIVFDPKGDPDLLRRMYVEAMHAGRLDKLWIFHLGHPDISVRYNTVGSFSRVTEVASRISGQLPGEGQSATFREFVWRYVNVIAKSLQTMGRKVDIQQIKFYAEDLEPLVVDYLEDYLTKAVAQSKAPADWKKTVKQYEEGFKCNDKEGGFKRSMATARRGEYALALVKYCKDKHLVDYVSHSLITTFEYDPQHLSKLVASLMPLMEKLTTGKCAKLISPDYLDESDTRPIFDWASIIRTGGIVYVGLDALSDAEVAAAVGNSMFADLTSLSGRIYKSGINQGLPEESIERPYKVNIHADEFNELIGKEFIPMVNKAGGAGFQVTAYTQTWSDVEARLGSKALAGQVKGNFNTLIMLRVKEQETAEIFTSQLKEVEVNHLTLVSGATDNTDPQSEVHFTSRTEQRNTTQTVELIHPGDIMNLPKGQCFALLEGSTPYKIRLPLPDDQDLKSAKGALGELVDEMRKSYSSSASNWYSFTPSWDIREVA